MDERFPVRSEIARRSRELLRSRFDVRLPLGFSFAQLLRDWR